MASKTFPDHFSDHASEYARARPTYPESMFDWLADQAPGRDLAWDAATGNGQAAIALASRFKRVVATDASEQQIAQATPHERVTYRVEVSESGSLVERSVDLVTVAQAFHWFDPDPFWAEVRRVLRPGGVVSIWCYQLARITPEIDGVVDHLYRDVLGEYWPLGRRRVELGYQDVRFPFRVLDSPQFVMSADWTLEALCAYLRTWSATQKFISVRKRDPVATIRPDLEAAWGEPAIERAVVWPLSLRAGVA